MSISRRDFLKWVMASSALITVGSSFKLQAVANALNNVEHTPVIWLQASGCSGCTISFLNMVEKAGDQVIGVDKILTDHIDLKYHNNLMAVSAKEAMSKLSGDASANYGKYILIVEGGVSTAADGMYCIIGEKDGRPYTALEAVKELASGAKHIIAVGTCSAFKGVSGAGNNITGVESVQNVLGADYKDRLLNLPGCPVHPFILGGTILKLLLGENLTLDSRNRPLAFYSTHKLHDKVNGVSNCPLKDRTKTNKLGVCGNCFDSMGCKGKDNETKATCYTQYWGTNWETRKGCFGAGNICIGCSSSNFPFSSLYN